MAYLPGNAHKGTSAYKALTAIEKLPLMEGTAGKPVSMVAQLNGGTGEISLLPTATDAVCVASAEMALNAGSVFEVDADANVRHGLKLLEIRGLAKPIRSGGQTIWLSTDVTGTGYQRDAAGNRVDAMKPTRDLSGFIADDASDFSEEGC